MSETYRIRTSNLSMLLFGVVGMATSAHGQSASAPPVNDPLLLERLATVPKVRPWPIKWFQPQERVAGAATAHNRTAPKAARRTISPEAIEKAQAYAAARGTQALLIWRAGKLEHAYYGEGATPADLLNTYYMHFPVLTLLYGAAIKEGHIRSVDDPLSRYLPEWANDERGRITIRQLLTMSAGLEMYFDSSDPKSKAAQVFFGSDSTTPALQYRSIEAPGRTFAYNYIIPEIAGIVLERAVKQRYSDYLSSRLWKPLKNADATVWLDRPGGRPHYNSSLFASAEDWLNVGKLILNKGRANGRQVIPGSWIETMASPSPTNPNYGMIWKASPFVAERRYAKDVNYVVKASTPFAAADTMYLDGYGGQRVYIVPSQKLVIVRIGIAQRDNWDDSALPNMVLAGLRK
jgi:CubicO group peptidase (beta-lactamase class C family)